MSRALSSIRSRAAVAPRAGRAFLLALALLSFVSGCATYRGARLYQSGTAALDAGRPEEAIVRLERAAALVPEASEVQNHLGLAYAAAGREAEALAAFRRAEALDCDNRAARENREASEARLAQAPAQAGGADPARTEANEALSGPRGGEP